MLNPADAGANVGAAVISATVDVAGAGGAAVAGAGGGKVTTTTGGIVALVSSVVVVVLVASVALLLVASVVVLVASVLVLVARVEVLVARVLVTRVLVLVARVLVSRVVLVDVASGLWQRCWMYSPSITDCAKGVSLRAVAIVKGYSVAWPSFGFSKKQPLPCANCQNWHNT
mmetsp:Transcript_84847/g.146644  ORF Transcript_84847/g.146644 Transcript_84847/m.146644 type:complete len:172 (-) Transcript_84847:1691-2206(-)